MLVAGPASRNTIAAPGLIPPAISPAANGVEAVAHTYTGTPMTSMATYNSGELPTRFSMPAAGSQVTMTPARENPMTNWTTTSSKISTKPK